MPQGRARRYIHLIDLQGQVSTGQTQMKNRVQLTCNNIENHDTSTRSNPSFETGFNTRRHDMNATKTNIKMDCNMDITIKLQQGN